VVELEMAQLVSDVVLVEQCQNGDGTAFDQLVRRYKDRIYNIVYRYLGNHEDALEVAQEAFVRAYRGIGTFRGEAQVYTWLCAIAVNQARNRLRDRHRKGRDKTESLDALTDEAPGVAAEASATYETPRSSAQRREFELTLQQCLDALPELYRTAFVLRIFDGLSYEDIAASTECPGGTVKSRMNQARKLLGVCLKRRGILG
jgi:RNA polymerase sigma-70 factor (ECF subfamily)